MRRFRVISIGKARKSIPREEPEDRPQRFQVLRIEGPDSLSIEKTEVDSLPQNWAEANGTTQTIGDRWLTAGCSLTVTRAKRPCARDMESVGQSTTHRSQPPDNYCAGF
jgi:hypothetical protein